MAITYNEGRIAILALNGLFAFPVFILYSLALSRARRHSDPARRGLVWLHAVFPSALAGALLTVLSYVLSLSTTRLGRVSRLVTLKAAAYILTAGAFFKLFADILLLVFLAELASGFLLIVVGPAASQRPRKVVRIVALAGAAVLTVLALVILGLNAKYNAGVLAPGGTVSNTRLMRDALTASRLNGTVDVLLFVGSLAVVVWIASVARKGKGLGGLKNSIMLLLAAAAVALLRSLAFMILAAMYSFELTRTTAEMIYIVRPALDLVLLFVVLVLLFVVAGRKEGGLWSTPQVAPPVAPGPAMGQEGWYGQAQPGYQQIHHPPAGAPAEGFYAPQQQQAGAAPYGYPQQGVQQQQPSPEVRGTPTGYA